MPGVLRNLHSGYFFVRYENGCCRNQDYAIDWYRYAFDSQLTGLIMKKSLISGIIMI